MMHKGYISEGSIEEVRSRSDIVTVVSEYVPLRRAGKDFKALCPFHAEKTPSFVVSGDKQIFHCFGCGMGGNVFNFLMLHERVEFPEAVKILAEKLGMSLETKGKVSKETFLRNYLYEVNEFAASYFQRNLREKHGNRAYQYLRKRGLSEETIQKFRLGYASASWDGFLKAALPREYSKDLLVKAGLVTRKETGDSYYDRFRDRIIFPLWNIQNKVVGFSGRVLDESLPKYINSPDTPVFNKGRIVYGLNFAKAEILKEDMAILAEGYFDVITSHQAGMKNAVASQGTAFTNDQARLLRRYSTKLVVAYDADAAGQSASVRGLDTFVEEGLQVRLMTLPPGSDPDSYIAKQGGTAFREQIKKAKPLFEFQWELLLREHDITSEYGRLEIINEMFTSIQKTPNAILRSEFIHRLSERTGINEEALWIEFNKKPGKSRRYEDRGSTTKPAVAEIPASERKLIQLMVQDEYLISMVESELSPDDFRNLHARKIVSAISGLRRDGKWNGIGSLTTFLQDEQINRLLSELMMKNDVVDKMKTLGDSIARVKKNRIETKQKELRRQMQDCNERPQDITRLLEEYEVLSKEKETLSRKE